MSWLGSWLGGGGGGGSDTIIGSQAPYYRALGVVQHGTGAVTVPWPDHDVGDIGVLCIENQDASGITLTSAAGFVALPNSPQYHATQDTRLSQYWCRATSSAMASVVVADPGDHVLAFIFTIRGAKATGNPYDATAGSTPGSGLGSTVLVLPAVTTDTANCLITTTVTTMVDGGSLAWASGWTNPTLIDYREEVDVRTDDGGGGGIAVAVGVMEASGDTGTSSVTSSGATLAAAITVAWLPVPAPAVPDADVTPPQIVNILPSTSISPSTVITFDVTDETGFALVAVFASWTVDGVEVAEMIYDGDDFRGNYLTDANNVVHTSGSYSFTVKRSGGWPVDALGRTLPLSFEWLVLDGGANMAVIP